MARRRRTKYTWLPNSGTQGPAEDTQDTVNGRDFGNITAAANGTTVAAFADLLVDDPPEDTALGPIGVVLTSEYIIKRIVGKFFINVNQDETPATGGSVLVGAGLFVARADDVDSTGGASLPIGALTNAQAVDNYSPLRAETIREPWIWRRTWILSNQAQPAAAVSPIFPRTTADYGSVADEPHIDAKTGRRVGNDERLWAVVAVRNYPFVATTTTISVRAYIDYRVLGAGRRAHNRSAF